MTLGELESAYDDLSGDALFNESELVDVLNRNLRLNWILRADT